ncbi:NAD(P)H-binding protein [Phytohabitans rumicis]|uniref:Nucleotide-diphosphate-sugar epimerase n=1 Tax=Phytohabitans rumicis TaxID=1076125 RepID=A0A6V8LNA1_9ACTN|nr:NAD(P)H-binding protein [Phytohabitans rumicis]GFJ96511.1 nucleotide-diphosphate-sugar epimerase [Phytohabitans rumicis]
MILVTGATGTVGREVVKQLVEAGQDVRALTRDPGRDAGLGAEVKVVGGDLGRPETLPAAVAGVDKVFLLSGGGPETPLHDANLALAANEANVSHIVKLSIIGAEYGFDDLVSTWHLAGERTLRQLAARPDGPAWTFIRPGEFMSNARLWAAPIKSRGMVFWSQVEPKVAVIDPRDVAAVAVTALTSPGHESQTYRISGPEALSVPERVEKLGKALGKPLQLVEVPIADARDAAARAGRQPLVVETTLGNLGREEFRRHAANPLPTFEQLVGRRPGTFDEWVNDHLDIFR